MTKTSVNRLYFSLIILSGFCTLIILIIFSVLSALLFGPLDELKIQTETEYRLKYLIGQRESIKAVQASLAKDNYQEYFLKNNSTIELQNYIQNIAVQNGLTIRTMGAAPYALNGNFHRIGVTLQGTATSNQLYKFFEALRQAKPLMEVEGLTIFKENRQVQSSANFRFQLVIYGYSNDRQNRE